MQADGRLVDVQRRFLSALREPIFGESRQRSALPERTGAVSPSFTTTADVLIAPSPALQPAQRLELYHRQYWYRLLDSLADDFPTLRALLGEEAFWRLLETYVEATPARSFTLRHFGAGLADHLHQHPELTALPVHAEELARLEYAVCEAFAAAEHPAVAPGQIASSHIALQPHLHVLALRTPVDSLWRQSARLRVCRAVAPSGEPHIFAVVYRHAFRLAVERLPRLGFAILTAIAATGSLDQAMAAVAAQADLFRSRDAPRVQGWFSAWVARGWFFSVSNNQRLEKETL